MNKVKIKAVVNTANLVNLQQGEVVEIINTHTSYFSGHPEDKPVVTAAIRKEDGTMVTVPRDCLDV